MKPKTAIYRNRGSLHSRTASGKNDTDYGLSKNRIPIKVKVVTNTQGTDSLTSPHDGEEGRNISQTMNNDS